MTPTACGYYLAVVFVDVDYWLMVGLDARGNMRCSMRCKTKEEAMKARRDRRKWHAKLAKKRAADARKRTKKDRRGT